MPASTSRAQAALSAFLEAFSVLEVELGKVSKDIGDTAGRVQADSAAATHRFVIQLWIGTAVALFVLGGVIWVHNAEKRTEQRLKTEDTILALAKHLLSVAAS